MQDWLYATLNTQIVLAKIPMTEGTEQETKPYRILSLDGGGAKGFYSLGVLKEIEGMIGCRLHERFDLVFGTSTGAIIAALVALGHSVDEIHELYKEHVPTVMQRKSALEKSKALSELAVAVFGEKKFDAVKTGVGIVTTKWVIERPMIFKGSVAQAHGRIGTFAPGFGCTIADAVEASCSAYSWEAIADRAAPRFASLAAAGSRNAAFPQEGSRILSMGVRIAHSVMKRVISAGVKNAPRDF